MTLQMKHVASFLLSVLPALQNGASQDESHFDFELESLKSRFFFSDYKNTY